MAVEFTSEHVVGVVVFVLALMCCKSILECIQAALVLFKDCSCFCDYNCGYNLFLYGKTALLFTGTTRPVTGAVFLCPKIFLDYFGNYY